VIRLKPVLALPQLTSAAGAGYTIVPGCQRARLSVVFGVAWDFIVFHLASFNFLGRTFSARNK
jgi:hypothetical protein